jgi:translation initiation factor 2 alpha subunit (eIF-2alpha)
MELEQGDIVLCTVDRIIGTTVFVRIETPQGEIEGTIITSEIAPGRIRNLREYVVPKKKIVCKVLRISGNQINLSLRRVTQKEKKELLDQAKQEKSYESILRSVLKEKSDEIIKKIKTEKSIYEFIETSKENPKEMEKLLGKENSSKILEIANVQKEKKIIIKKIVNVTTTDPNGLEKIKNLFNKPREMEIKYISAGKYSVKVISNEAKKANNELKAYTEELEKEAKENNLNIVILEK